MVKPALVSQLANAIMDKCNEIENKNPKVGIQLKFTLKQSGIFSSYSELAASGMVDTFENLLQMIMKPEPELMNAYARILSVKEGKKITAQQATEKHMEIAKRIQTTQMGEPMTPTHGAPVFLQHALKSFPFNDAQDLLEKWSTLMEALAEPTVTGNDPQFPMMITNLTGALDSVVDQVNQTKYLKGAQGAFWEKPAANDKNDDEDPKKPGTVIVPVNKKANGADIKPFDATPELDKYIELFDGEDDPFVTPAKGAANGKDAMAELDRLIGLEEVKDEIKKLRSLMLMHVAKKKMGVLKDGQEHSMHLVFTGNPGTGKTTVARIVGQMYKELGILKEGHVVEVDRSDLIAGYVGQTEGKTKEKIDEALGGVLFIDEAYALAQSDSPRDFGKEAIATILKAMEDHRDELVVIVAGYPNEMSKFINSNPGLESRFNKYIDFRNYDGMELGNIFDLMMSDRGMTIQEEARTAAVEIFEQESKAANDKFGNGRYVRNFVEKLEQEQAFRLADSGKLNRKIANDDKLDIKTHGHLLEIEVEDVKAVHMKTIVQKSKAAAPGAIQIVRKPTAP